MDYFRQLLQAPPQDLMLQARARLHEMQLEQETREREARLEGARKRRSWLMDEHALALERLRALADEYVHYHRSTSNHAVDLKELKRRITALQLLILDFEEHPIVRSSLHKAGTRRPTRRVHFPADEALIDTSVEDYFRKVAALRKVRF